MLGISRIPITNLQRIRKSISNRGEVKAVLEKIKTRLMKTCFRINMFI